MRCSTHENATRENDTYGYAARGTPMAVPQTRQSGARCVGLLCERNHPVRCNHADHHSKADDEGTLEGIERDELRIDRRGGAAVRSSHAGQYMPTGRTPRRGAARRGAPAAQARDGAHSPLNGNLRIESVRCPPPGRRAAVGPLIVHCATGRVSTTEQRAVRRRSTASETWTRGTRRRPLQR